MSVQYKPFCFQNGIFKIITKDKEIQNDKERILKKFNFYSKSNSKNKYTTTNRTTSSKKLHNSRNNLNKRNLTTKSSPSTSSGISNKNKQQFQFTTPSQGSLIRLYSQIKSITTTPNNRSTSSSKNTRQRNKSSTVSNTPKSNWKYMTKINKDTNSLNRKLNDKNNMKVIKKESIVKHNKQLPPINTSYKDNSSKYTSTITKQSKCGSIGKYASRNKLSNNSSLNEININTNNNNVNTNNNNQITHSKETEKTFSHHQHVLNTNNSNTLINNNNTNNNGAVSNETERESESHMMLVSNTIISNDLKFSNCDNNNNNNNKTKSLNGTNDPNKNTNKDQTLKATNSLSHNMFGNNTNFFSNSLSSSEDEQLSISKRKAPKYEQAQSEPNKHYVLESNETNNTNTNNNNNNTTTNNNNPQSSNQNTNNQIPQYEKLNIANRKIQQLFLGNTKYDIPSKLNEQNNYNIICPNTEYKFINKIREDNINLQRFQLKSFLKLSDYSMFCLLSFIFEKYEILVNNCHSLISSRIHLCLKNVFNDVICSFINNYNEILKLESFTFQHKSPTLHKQTFSILDLIIKAKIITPNINKCYELGYSYITHKRTFENIWRFDTAKKNNISLWCSSEYEKFNDNSRRFCYYQPILTFSKGDSIELNINIFNKQSSVDPFSVKWKQLSVKEAPGGFYQKTMLKSPFVYHTLRACEVENMIHFWKGDDEFIKDNELINEFNKIFSRHFSIEKVVYDISKIYLYKVTMIAKSIGKIVKNKFANFDFEIVGYDDNVSNEIQNLFLLNTSVQNKQIQIRQGTVVVFYLTDY